MNRAYIGKISSGNGVIFQKKFLTQLVLEKSTKNSDLQIKRKKRASV